MRCYLGKPEFSRVLLHDMPDQSFRYAVAPVFVCSTDTSEHPSGRNRGCGQPLVNRRFHPVGYRYGSDVPAFTNEINYGPMLLTLLQVPELQISQLATSKSAPQQDGKDRPVPLSFEGVCIWRLPEAAGFFGCEPVPKPYPQLLGTFYTANASREFRTEQTSVRRFIGEPAYGGEPSVIVPPASCRFSTNMR